jgi:hypothetical protein
MMPPYAFGAGNNFAQTGVRARIATPTATTINVPINHENKPPADFGISNSFQ